MEEKGFKTVSVLFPNPLKTCPERAVYAKIKITGSFSLEHIDGWISSPEGFLTNLRSCALIRREPSGKGIFFFQNSRQDVRPWRQANAPFCQIPSLLKAEGGKPFPENALEPHHEKSRKTHAPLPEWLNGSVKISNPQESTRPNRG